MLLVLYGCTGLVSLIIFFRNLIKETSFDKKINYCILVIILLSMFLRLYKLNILPGLNIDEAMSGYNGWSLAHFGVDSSLNKWPVYLVAWGDGANVLYAYCTSIVVKIFGLSVLSYRFTMFAVSSAALLFTIYLIAKTKKNGLYTLISTFVLLLSPWIIISSRWGLESNLAPYIMLIGLDFLINAAYSCNGRKYVYLILSGIFFALTCYAYAVFWYGLPILYVLIAIDIIRNGKGLLTLRNLALNFISMIIVAFPIIIFAVAQQFQLGQIKVGILTIPKMFGHRSNATTILSEQNKIIAIFHNLYDGLKMFLINSDGQDWNSISGGSIYSTVLLFALIVGIISVFKLKKDSKFIDKAFHYWLLSALLIIVIVRPSITHWNYLFIPVLYIVIEGIFYLISLDKNNIVSVSLVISLIFSVGYFSVTYFHSNANLFQTNSNASQILDKKVINTFNSKSTNRVFIEKGFFTPDNQFASARFYSPISPYKWNNEKDYPNSKSKLIPLFKSGKYRFTVPSNDSVEKGDIVVVQKNKKNNYDGYRKSLTITQNGLIFYILVY